MSEMKKRKESVEADRLCSLPEAIVIHILSLLDTKHAVQASLSLKKWVNLWTLIPDLNFDCSVFRKLASFDLFVDKVLTLRDDSVKINKFSFSRKSASKRSKTDMFERVIRYAASHDVQHLTINHYIPYYNYVLRDPLDSSNSPRSLRLQSISFYNSLCLEQLVTLHLESVVLFGTGNFSNYPNLQNLTLKGCRSKHGYQLFSPGNRIVSPQLSRLMILNCFENTVTPKLTLSTPKLVFFQMRESILPVFKTDELPLLDTVDMDVELTVVWMFKYVESQQLLSQLMCMLKCFYNVSSIRLSWCLIKLLSMFPDILAREPSSFCNMKYLNIVPSVSGTKTSFTIPFHVTAYLLKKSPDANTVIEIELPRCKKCIKEYY